MHAERAADPDRVDQVVALGVGDDGIDEYAPVVQHQPGDQPGEVLGGEETWARMRAYRLVAPVVEAQAKTLADGLAQPFGLPPLDLVAVIDLDVIAGDLRLAGRRALNENNCPVASISFSCDRIHIPGFPKSLVRICKVKAEEQ